VKTRGAAWYDVTMPHPDDEDFPPPDAVATTIAQQLMGLIEEHNLGGQTSLGLVEVQESARSDSEFVVVVQGRCYRVAVTDDEG